MRGFFPNDPPNFYEVPFSYHDQAEIRLLLELAGLHEIEIENVKKTGVIRSAESGAIGLIEGNPIAVALTSFNAGAERSLCILIRLSAIRALNAKSSWARGWRESFENADLSAVNPIPGAGADRPR